MRHVVVTALVAVSLTACKTTEDAAPGAALASAHDELWNDQNVKTELKCEKVRTVRDEDMGDYQSGDRAYVVVDRSGKRFMLHHNFGLGASRSVYTIADAPTGTSRVYKGPNTERADATGELQVTLDASGKGQGVLKAWGQTIDGMTCQNMEVAGQERLFAACEKVETVQSEDIGSFERGSRVTMYTTSGTDYRVEEHHFGLGANRATYNMQQKGQPANGVIEYAGAVVDNAQRQGSLKVKRAGTALVGTAEWKGPFQSVTGLKCKFPPQ